MTKQMRYGTRFSSGSTEKVTGIGFIPLGYKGKRDRVPKHQTHTEATQKNSLKFRESKGIKPSLPTFSWDEPKPEPPSKFKPVEEYLRKLEMLLDSCLAQEVLQDGDPHLIVAMLNKNGKPFNACFNKVTGAITWTEGANRPRRRIRNALPRRDLK